MYRTESPFFFNFYVRLIAGLVKVIEEECTILLGRHIPFFI